MVAYKGHVVLGRLHFYTGGYLIWWSVAGSPVGFVAGSPVELLVRLPVGIQEGLPVRFPGRLDK